MKTIVFAVCAVIFLFCGIVNDEINDGLVAYYPFNGNANDESGRGNNGLVYGVTLTNDRNGNANGAYNFNGVSDHVIRIHSNDSLNFGTLDFSMSVWIKPNSSDYSQIIGKDSHAGNTIYSGYFLRYQAGKIISFCVRNAPSSQTCLDSPNPLQYNWTHIVGVRKSNVLYIYVNGVFDSSLPEPTASNVSNTVDFKIGRFDEYTQPSFRGDIDEIRIYNRALSVSEVQQLYQGSNCSDEVAVKPYTFTAGTPAKASEINANFDVLYQRVNTPRCTN